MSPVPRPAVKRTGIAGRQVQSKILSRFAQTSDVNLEEQRRQFREARKAREQERMTKLRDCRLKNSSAAASNVTATVSITSSSSSRMAPPKLPPATKVGPLNMSKPQDPSRLGSSMTGSRRQPAHQIPARMNDIGIRSTLSRKPRRSQGGGGRKSILKHKVESRVAKAQKPLRKLPKAEVKLTKTTQLRMLKSDPLLELSQFSKSLSNHIVLPLPAPISKCHTVREVSLNSKDVIDGNVKPGCSKSSTDQDCQSEILVKKLSFKSPMGKVMPGSASEEQSPSRIPVRKTSFFSPLKKPSATPKPSPLRKRLTEWLEQRDHSLDNFKHLKCFGLLGPVVKRPQTPFRKKVLSTSVLRAIPESKETTPIKENKDSDDDDGQLNTTFTLEEEDKENICHGANEQADILELPVETPQAEQAQSLKDFDQAYGVLSELHKLIQMGYPIQQCQLWLRAIRRRFPQCGDEAVYWECLASLEESHGDLQTAVSCYERALMQGAQGSVQNSLDELLKKMSALNIEPIVNANLKPSKSYENILLESSNIIKSSAIQFAVQEKCGSSKKSECPNESLDSVFTATPVRRSMRLAGTPKKGTAGVTCVRSLEFLEPKVRNSLVFHNNAALEPKD